MGQYHGYWCSGSLRCQDISSHDIDYVEYVGPGLTWGRILSTYVITMWSNDIKCKYMFMFPLQNLARKELTHCGWNKMAGILQTTFSNAFSWIKMSLFLLFLRVQLTMKPHWFRFWKVNNWCAELFGDNIKEYFHFLPFLNTEMVQLDEIHTGIDLYSTINSGAADDLATKHQKGGAVSYTRLPFLCCLRSWWPES